MILVDSSVWVDYFNGAACRETDLLDRLLTEESILIGDIILAEVLQGFARDEDFHRARRLLEPLPFANMVGKEVALRSAENYRLLRRRGATVRKTIDVLIATFCIMNDHVLLHRDRDFRPMENWLGLRILK